jgi:hypothetical protein
MMWKEVVLVKLMHPNIGLDGLRKATANISPDSWSPS